MNKKTCWIGVDIGGTNTEVGFVDASGNFLEYFSFRTHADKPIQLFIEKLKQTLSLYEVNKN